MSAHRSDKNIDELKTYFKAVLDWVSTVFTKVYSEMKGLEWGRLYEHYHDKSYNPAKIAADVEKLMADEYVTSRKGNLAHSQKLLAHKNRDMTEHYVRSRSRERVRPLR